MSKLAVPTAAMGGTTGLHQCCIAVERERSGTPFYLTWAFIRSMADDWVSALVSAWPFVVGIGGPVGALLAVLAGRYLHRRDQTRDEDQKRLYSALRKEMVSAMEGKEGAMLGYGAYSAAVEMGEIIAKGDLLPKRHRELREDVDRLVALRKDLARENLALYEVIRRCVQGVLDLTTFKTDAADMKGRTTLGDVFGHNFRPQGALYSALATGKKEAWGNEFTDMIFGAVPNVGGTIVPDRGPDEMYDEMEPSIKPSREPYFRAATELFALTERLNVGLEEALRTGKPYRRVGARAGGPKLA
jgi:hypothetical protein